MHLAIGMFDGVHLGHQAVIESAVHSARRENGISAVLTFHPHPSRLFRPDNPTRLILPPEEKARRIYALGIDTILQKAFTADFAKLMGEQFVPYLKNALPTLKALYVGADFRFGKGRTGNTDTLIESGNACDVSLYAIRRITHNGEEISSTRIRTLLTEGDVQKANTLLGYDYQCSGIVTPGKQLGRTLGFPTLNLPWQPELPPRYGVYAVTVHSEKEPRTLQAVANYGLRPTVENTQSPLLETHILGDTTLDAGDFITVHWKHFLRPEKTFENVEQLKAQIAQDRDSARRYFE